MTYTALAYEQAFNPHTVTAYANNVRLARDLPADFPVTSADLSDALSDETARGHEVARSAGLPQSIDGAYPALVWMLVMG